MATEKRETGPVDNDIKLSDGPEHQVEIYIDPEMEKRIVRKFDWLVLPQFALILIIAFLDRTNIGNARIFGFEQDINRKGNEFANLSSFFYVTHVIFEVPWVLAVKAWGANLIISLAIVLWSAVTIGTGFIQNYRQGVACRLLLGFAEAGIFPALAFVISTVYPRHSQGKRVAVLSGATALSGAFGGLIAYGIQQKGTRRGLAAWRWLFIIEGSFSLVIGILCWASLPKACDEAWFLKSEERQLMKDRRARDVAYAGALEKFSWSHCNLAFTDVMVWVAALSLFCAGIPLFGYGIFLPTIIRGFGFSDTIVNVLTIPVYLMGCFILALGSWLSDKLRRRAAVMISVPLLVCTGYAIAIGTPSVGGGYFAMFLCSGVYTFNPLLLTWVANNIAPDTKRSAALPLLVSIANVSGIAASQVYPNSTAPRFIMGNGISLGMELLAGCGVVTTRRLNSAPRA
ncbi:related to allantoate transport protein [Cephalotrichum gorgonifer]|uniref:Related to allantoate transport protein n=1 Tax=Cephalotrichum gorgonifer TaxID=2041049 RepID=A0AAE8N468_9PEZI|nr:related to allantoate transport protein [Cephalotrichum gorgonifer]